MSDRFPNLGPLPSQKGHVPFSSAADTPAAATAQSGMVRIHRAQETRYVWPVHVPGWLCSGWQLGDDRHARGADGLDVLMATPGPAAVAAPDQTCGPSSVPTLPIRQDSAPEGEPEPIDAHLPTNLLDLDAEPIAAPSSSAGNNAVSASSGEPGPIAATAPAELAEAGAKAAQPDPEPANTPVAEPSGDSNEEAIADPAADLLAEPSTEPTPSPAPARRGRPRKLRPELESPSPVLAAQPADQHATGPAGAAASEPQESAPQPPAASSLLVNAASLLDGDDPYGIDPLL